MALTSDYGSDLHNKQRRSGKSGAPAVPNTVGSTVAAQTVLLLIDENEVSHWETVLSEQNQ
jgi:hypothetical protein